MNIWVLRPKSKLLYCLVILHDWQQKTMELRTVVHSQQDVNQIPFSILLTITEKLMQVFG